MDAFAVAVCKGLSIKNLNWNKSIIVGTFGSVLDSSTTFEFILSVII